MSVLSALDYTAVIVFAISGALAASRAQLDIVGFAFVACLTAVGGGTIRDVLLNRDAVFWISDPAYILIATLIATVVFFTAHLFESRLKALMWADAIALGVAVAAGAGVALKLGQPPVIIALMGVATGCFGGLMRDVVCNEVPLVLTQGELYASAALAGAVAMIIASYLDFTPIYSYISCAVLTFGLRAGSLIFGWSLPVYKSRPPRS
ncbi:MAG: trimeric intracellular cation channel family protein [Alphaproteobacteria bacterium]|nr:trimeric intracellular cation channel family protein [Alphaproteobacteria bacterium]MBU1279837.1 trimeric intracellular cation channel family protein [Alphaproteobacteria bacterium]MBU1573792.1 trimeric intracellular cation channel family protein [Alphaproteobacteria bacterium]MBU1829492.1 trimeric intracellular cation channel family protein [Alphaproteobacteria bacterium]MBU2077752.1 trimeric intracellular cation channel family protein [Alphaproteobacteria bacterium]